MAFRIEILTGGMTNHTVRVSFSPALSLGHLPNVKLGREGQSVQSVVLKHASPFVAVDSSQSIPLTRQLIEKRALEILNAEDAEFGDLAAKIGAGKAFERGMVKIPKFLWYDEEKNVLWIEDLGNMRTLSSVLLDSSIDHSLGVEDVDTLEIVAKELGNFVAEIHQATRDPPQALLDNLACLLDSSHVAELLTVVTREVLDKSDVRGDDAKEILERVRESLEKKPKDEMCLGMVDFWSDNVLIDITGETPKCGLVDWEYFGPCSASSELGMFLAHLHFHLLNTTSSSTVKDKIQLFICQMYGAYAKTLNEGWQPSKAFMRGALLSHGRELVNDVQFYEAKLDKMSKQRLLQAGIRSLKAAGASNIQVDLSGLNPDVSLAQEFGDDVRELWKAFKALRFQYKHESDGNVS